MYAMRKEKTLDIEAISIGPGTKFTGGRRRRRRVAASRGYHVEALLKGSTRVLLATACTRSEADKLHRQITRTLNRVLEEEIINFDGRLCQLEEKITKIHFAPGMPGFVEAEQDWSQHAANSDVL